MKKDEFTSLGMLLIDAKAIELASEEQISRSKERINRRKKARYKIEKESLLL
ncbi:MAG: hypothetical protein QW372_01805 [Nitrososphaerales archaeon]